MEVIFLAGSRSNDTPQGLSIFHPPCIIVPYCHLLILANKVTGWFPGASHNREPGEAAASIHALASALTPFLGKVRFPAGGCPAGRRRAPNGAVDFANARKYYSSFIVLCKYPRCGASAFPRSPLVCPCERAEPAPRSRRYFLDRLSVSHGASRQRDPCSLYSMEPGEAPRAPATMRTP